MRTPIDLSAAIKLVKQHVQQAEIEIIPLAQAYGKVLAEPIIATRDIPGFTKSTRDGFAIRASDLMRRADDNHSGFTIVGEISAGQYMNGEISEGETYRIMTGAMLPKGADTVVMYEHTQVKNKQMIIRIPVEKGANIAYQGEDIKKDEQIIHPGSVIHSGMIALLASLGYAEVKVRKSPRVGLLCTGSELLDAKEQWEPGKIYNANGPMIEAALKALGLQYENYGIQKDDFNDSYETVKQALLDADILITTGGVSVGDYDFLPHIYERLQAEVIFNKVAIRPGSVTTFATVANKLLFGLSGNPSACYIGFELFVKTAISSYQGANYPFKQTLKATLMEPCFCHDTFTHIIRGYWQTDGNEVMVRPVGLNTSGAISSLALANCFIFLKGEKPTYAVGEIVEIMLLSIREEVNNSYESI